MTGIILGLRIEPGELIVHGSQVLPGQWGDPVIGSLGIHRVERESQAKQQVGARTCARGLVSHNGKV
jgi:hypothetical protein